MEREVVEITQEQALVRIKWSDGQVSTLSFTLLRERCPCALCKEGGQNPPPAPRKSLLKVIDASLDEQTQLEEMWLVGNYAVGLRWKDGHKTGIYTFSYLDELSRNS